MTVKFNGVLSKIYDLIGGSPQGTVGGQIVYTVASDDVGEDVPAADKYRYCDDLTAVELLLLGGLLVDYDCHSHVPSDVSPDELFLPPENLRTVANLDSISSWTSRNLISLNPEKSNFIIFSKSKQKFTTRLNLDEKAIEKKKTVKICGLWLSEDLSWNKNCQELCKRAFSRLPMISKLKYLGTKTEDLIDIFCLFVRSVLEYCSVVSVQTAALFTILGDNFVSSSAAREMTGLALLSERRERRVEAFTRKSLKHPKHSLLFPCNMI